MSDSVSDDETGDQPANQPHVMVVPSPQGGHIGIMHMGDNLRAFYGDSMDRIRTLFSKVGISEFGMPQDQADVLAAKAAPITPPSEPSLAEAETGAIAAGLGGPEGHEVSVGAEAEASHRSSSEPAEADATLNIPAFPADPTGQAFPTIPPESGNSSVSTVDGTVDEPVDDVTRAGPGPAREA